MSKFLEKPVPPSRDDTRKAVMRDHELAGREQAVRYTRGNVAIQQNAFVTKRDVEEGLAELNPHH
ncbi:hypothetical protein [Rhizobium sp. PP-CC-3G-465]|uniref:hypothetical protein n=1 Tax=Rhizobium sp. PP-CC-3G-465 TaxID=2135648 RepID=UPI00104FA4D6